MAVKPAIAGGMLDHHPYGDSMRKPLLILILFASFLWSACTGQVTQPAGEAYGTQAVLETATQSPQKAVLPATLTPTQPLESTSTSPVELASAGCTVQSPLPTPGPTEQSLLPPPGEEDWIIGSKNATVTFTEYSDFQ
jgi:hypothetical protein